MANVSFCNAPRYRSSEVLIRQARKAGNGKIITLDHAPLGAWSGIKNGDVVVVKYLPVMDAPSSCHYLGVSSNGGAAFVFGAAEQVDLSG